MSPSSIILLGSTGSIGVHTLDLALAFKIPVESLCAGRNIALLNQQIALHRPKNVCIACKEDAHKLIDGNYKLFVGEEGINQMIESSQSPLVVNALVGFIGLAPSLKALACHKKLALANKESLVNAGWLFPMGYITPIDSEHFGLWFLLKQSLQNSHTHTPHNRPPFKKLYITASGGAFRDIPLESIAKATKQQALKHPNWSMGHKITIDSASMVNKLFELLEARWLFGSSEIEAFIELGSNIHALVEFWDNGISAHIATPDMKLPISYALYPEKAAQTSCINPLDLSKLNFCLHPIDICRYPLYALKDSLLHTPQKGIVLNASNEIAVESFLDTHIPFGSIAKLVNAMIERFECFSYHILTDLESIRALDKEVRIKSLEWLKAHRP